MQQSNQPTHIVIIGGGFAGIEAAKIFGGKKNVHVTVIDRRNHHLFQPLLYQVAMAGLSPAEIAVPIRSLLTSHSNIEVILGNVTKIFPAQKTLQTEFGEVKFDYLILACGANHSYFNHPEWEEFAPGLKNLEQATEIRRRVLLAFELAEREKEVEKQKQLLTFVVVGGGPTGVELAGALGEISRYTISKDFDHIDPRRTRIILIEAGPKILSSFSESLSQKATRDLEMLGVQIWTNSRVTAITAEGVKLGEEFLKASTVLWAAGVKPSPLNQQLDSELYKDGRVLIEPELCLKKHPNIFVLGDQACFINPKTQSPLPGLAPVAMQQGRHAARNILQDLNQKPRKPFVYADKGQMATIGRKKAIAEFAGLKIHGFVAWIIWLFVHVYYLIGFKNRFFVLIQWAWSYVSYKRGARLIVNKQWRD